MLRPRPTTRALVTAGVAALAVSAASAVAPQEAAKLYAGVGLGYTKFNSAHEGIAYGDTPLGLHLYGGWQARETTALELAVERLADISVPSIPGSGVERLRISTNHTAVLVRGVFSLSLEEILRRRRKVTVFGTIGIAGLFEQRDVTELNTSATSSASERDAALAFGAGVAFDLAHVRLRNYFEWADRADGRLNSIGVAAEFRF